MSRPSGVILRVVALLALLSGTAHGAAADSMAEVQDLIKSGRSADALRMLDTLIAQRPGDAQLRFQKGVLLVDQKRSPEAINIFQKLGQDFPALPEPFNNLAVIYVEQGQLDKARAALESAIRSRPNYGTAFQNLGDVYTRMASRAYARALQIEDPEAAPKLALIRDLYDMPQGAPVPLASASAPAPRPSPSAPAAASAPAVASTAPPVTAAVAPAAAPPAASRANEEARAVGSALREWASAWSRKDLNAYFGAYVNGFKGSDSSASEWQSSRRERISGKRHISVEISALKIDVSNDTAKASFRQAYVADLLRVSSQKTLELEKHNGKWLIRKESTGS